MAHLVKNPPAIRETWVRSLGWEDPEEGKGYPFQYSGLENSMDCIVHGVTKSQTRLRDFHILDFPGGSDGKESACNVGDWSLIPGSGRSPGEGDDNPLQYSCPGNPIDRGAWWVPVHGVAKESAQLSDKTTTFFYRKK